MQKYKKKLYAGYFSSIQCSFFSPIIKKFVPLHSEKRWWLYRWQPSVSAGCKRKVWATQSPILPNGKGRSAKVLHHRQCRRKDTANFGW